VVCECNHLTDFSTLEETLEYAQFSLSYFKQVSERTSFVHITATRLGSDLPSQMRLSWATADSCVAISGLWSRWA
jgi:hypothetical protein